MGLKPVAIFFVHYLIPVMVIHQSSHKHPFVAISLLVLAQSFDL